MSTHRFDRFLRRARPPPFEAAQRVPVTLLSSDSVEPPGADPFGIEYVSAAIRNTDHPDSGPPLRKIRHHLSQRASDLPESQDEYIDPVARGRGTASHLRKLERRVDCALCRRRVRVFHDDGDIQLGRSLGNRDHVDPGRRERGEDPGGDTASAVHAKTDDRNRGYPRLQLDAIDLAVNDLLAKRRLEASFRPLSARLRHGKTDRMLRGCLRDERDGNPLPLQRGEGPCRYTRHSDHPVPFDREERLAWSPGEGLYRHL